MAVPKPDQTKGETINLRLTRQQRDLIDSAAQSTGRSRSEFILSAASREASETLLDRTWFQLDAEAAARFDALLDAPPTPTDALRNLLHRRAPWE